MKLAALVIGAMVLVGCSSDDTRHADSMVPATLSTSSPSTSAAPRTTAATTTTAAPSTTTSTTTTTAAPTTTPAPTTTAAPPTTVPPSEWTPVDPATITLPLAHPCCGSDWEESPSPELPGPGVALPDGLYPVDGMWPANPADPIPLRVMRFVPCGDFVNCDGDPPFDSKAMGVEKGQFRTIMVPLDDTLTVIYSGFEADSSGNFLNATSVGTGTNLGQLATAVDAAYEKRIGSRIRAGEDADAVFNDVAANPGDGFAAAPVSAGRLTFDDGNAPPLLFQTWYDRGVEAIGLVVLQIQGGKMTLVVYGGFYS